MEQFDVIVVGGGPAGENIVDGRCADGLTVAVVEAELVGGECSYWACMPSKALLRPGEIAGRGAPGRRRPGGGHRPIDVEAVLARRDDMTSDWDDDGQVKWLEGTGATLVRGRGRLAGERVVSTSSRPTERPGSCGARRARSCSRPVPPRRSRRSPGCATSVSGTAAGSRRPRRCRADSSCSAAGWSASRWRRRGGASAPRGHGHRGWRAPAAERGAIRRRGGRGGVRGGGHHRPHRLQGGQRAARDGDDGPVTSPSTTVA